MNSKITTVAVASLLLCVSATSAHGQLVDVSAALARIAHSKPLVFARGDFEFPAGGHLQGIQLRHDAARNRCLAFLSHDSQTVAYLIVVEFDAQLSGKGKIIHVHTFPGDGQQPPLRHAGGIQLLDDVLVVGLEDNQQKTRSEVQFWDVSTPDKLIQLEHLTVRRAGEAKDKTAGAVGLVLRGSDHLLAVANWDSRAIDFFTSNGKPLANPSCRFAPLARFQAGMTGGAYQAINLLADSAGNLFLVGFHTVGQQDLVDLFTLDVGQPPAALLKKRAAHAVRLEPSSHFRNAGGWALLDGRAIVLASPSQVEATTTLSVAR